jgi:hypothetical protein
MLPVNEYYSVSQAIRPMCADGADGVQKKQGIARLDRPVQIELAKGLLKALGFAP